MVCREGWSAGGACIASPILTAAEFAAGLAIALVSSDVMVRGLTRLGSKAGFSEGLLGLLGALGADSPELSSAVIAIVAGAGGVGAGVVVGSNLFNLAALLGLSGILAGGVAMRRAPVAFDAMAGLVVAAVAAAMAAGLVQPIAATLVLVPVVGAYVVILGVPRRRLRIFRPLLAVVPRGMIEIAYEVTHDRPVSTHGSWTPVLLLPPAVALVVAGSFLMVNAALVAQRSLHLKDAVVGTIVLAGLTSLPNLYVALHFARTDRGTALFSSAMNSNSINLVGGLIVPALFAGAGAARGSLRDFGWLGALSLLAIAAPLWRGSINRVVGAVIIAIYLAFVIQRVLGA